MCELVLTVVAAAIVIVGIVMVWRNRKKLVKEVSDTIDADLGGFTATISMSSTDSNADETAAGAPAGVVFDMGTTANEQPRTVTEKIGDDVIVIEQPLIVSKKNSDDVNVAETAPKRRKPATKKPAAAKDSKPTKTKTSAKKAKEPEQAKKEKARTKKTTRTTRK